MTYLARWTTAAMLALAAATLSIVGCSATIPDANSAQAARIEGVTDMTDAAANTDEQWKQQLSPEEYDVLRRQGTERAFTGEYWNHKEDGVYRCRGCGQELFSSDAKYDSGTGWPSYWQPIDGANVATDNDDSWFGRRTEVHCSNCGGHLGHVFDDGPQPTGLRYCINSVSLDFKSASAGDAPE